MIQEFTNNTTVAIDAGGPNSIQSTIDVSGLAGHLIDINVTIDVDHTWTNDLEVALLGPNGQRALLVGREGGSGDNFQQTTFDDAALDTIEGASAPFQGTFRPEESLTVFNNTDPNGTWTLEVQDRASQDGGSLNSWKLSIETGAFTFENQTPVTIDPGPANTVSSTIEVADLGGLVVEDIQVTLDISHTWDNDLTIALIGPEGTRVILVDREGGSGDNFGDTTFDDAAATSITDASPPFSGRFRPEGTLADFAEQMVNGTWTLEIRDNASQDGGSLNHWSITVRAKNAAPPVDAPFTIQVRFLGGLTAAQRSVFELAAARWSQIITADLPDINTDIGIVDDVVIDAQGVAIDGPGGVLGQAGPTGVRPGSLLPARGIMSFDTADLADLEADGSFVNVIIHEMGHVLGIGTLWSSLGLLQGAGSNDPTFTGANAMREYATLIGAAQPTPVPVANTGGAGTRDGHWRELVFGNELMTGFLNSGINPLSRMTIGAMQDMGYQVTYDAADPYVLPNMRSLESMGISTGEARMLDDFTIDRPEPIILSENGSEDGA